MTDFSFDSVFDTPARRTRGKSRASLDLIEKAREIAGENQPCTVRAICYRLFIAGLIDSMSKANTNRVSTQLVWAREQGVIPWEWIVDEARRPECVSTWENAEEILACTVNGYRRNYWADQPEWIEVWSEKGTVRGTLAPVLDQYGITFRVMHGHGSATALHEIAEMADRSNKFLTALYVGDRDPSGMDMSERDLPERLDRYSADGVSTVDIVRVAVAEQDTTRAAGVPFFPASDKTADPRHRWYVEKYGEKCWELDALSPVILRERVEAEIRKLLDLDAWQHSIKIEAAEIESMRSFFAEWPGKSGLATK
jgi:hypothetical protein